MQIPEDIRPIIEDIVERLDVEEAMEEAVKRVRCLPNFKSELMSILANEAIKEAVYQLRCVHNRKVKTHIHADEVSTQVPTIPHTNGEVEELDEEEIKAERRRKYGKPPKVPIGESEDLRKDTRNVFLSLKFGGTILGNLYGYQLQDVVDKEMKISNGHRLNAAFLSRIKEKVPQAKKVRDVMTENQLARIWEEEQAKMAH